MRQYGALGREGRGGGGVPPDEGGPEQSCIEGLPRAAVFVRRPNLPAGTCYVSRKHTSGNINCTENFGSIDNILESRPY